MQHRHQSGQGQVVDVGLYEPMLRMLDETIPIYGATGYVRERRGPAAEHVVPHNHYQSRDGKWIAIACTNDRMFERLVNGAMQQPAILAAFPTKTVRLQRRDDLDDMVAHWVRQFDASDVLTQLNAAEVPCSLINSVQDLFADPQVQARENILAAPHPLGGVLHMAGIVPKLSLTPGTVGSVGPVTVGAHNEEIYCGRLGLSRDDLTTLRAKGII
jgi:succinyl-CoA:(S)-malate CoA-transferase subunit B